MKPERKPHVSRLPYFPPVEEPDDSLAELLLGTAAVALVFILAFILLPVLA